MQRNRPQSAQAVKVLRALAADPARWRYGYDLTAEMHLTIRDRQSQQHDLQKLVLVLGARREEIDLAKDLKEIEARVDELEHQATKQVSP